jgi:hypothetical protein
VITRPSLDRQSSPFTSTSHTKIHCKEINQFEKICVEGAVKTERV